MDDVAWNSSVVSTGKLTVDIGGLHGLWATAATAAIRELNTLLSSNNINVSVTTGKSAVVVVALTSGPYKFPVNGVDQDGMLQTKVLHGVTRSIDIETRTKSREKAYTFLPQHPHISPSFPNSREAGEPVMRVMVAHEFLHALGLGDHPKNDTGLFAPQWTPNEGAKPSADTVSPFGTKIKLPPLMLSGDTVSRLQALWP